MASHRDATIKVCGFHFNRDVHFSIGDRISEGSFNVTQIEKLPDTSIKETMTFTGLSPIIISRNEMNGIKIDFYDPKRKMIHEIKKKRQS